MLTANSKFENLKQKYKFALHFGAKILGPLIVKSAKNQGKVQ